MASSVRPSESAARISDIRSTAPGTPPASGSNRASCSSMNARTRASSAEAERSRISAETASTSGPSESSVRRGSPGALPQAWSRARSIKASIWSKSTPICPSSETPRSLST